jgi:hypothetical protein
MEWLKVKALSSNPSTGGKKKELLGWELVAHTCNPSYLRPGGSWLNSSLRK